VNAALRGLHLPQGFTPYTLKRSWRRRTLEINVGARGVTVHAPGWAPLADIEAFVASRADWLMHALRRHAPREPAPDRAPERVYLLGEALPLVRAPGIRGAGRVADEVWLPEHVEPAQAVGRWLRELALPHYRALAADYAARLGLPESPLRLSNARTQWGSCNARGLLHVHWRLIQAPAEIAEYVVAHEVAHRVHLNHSPAFWAVVARLAPDWKARRARLRRDMAEYLLF
jgi:predicted metal-dependent hydrolase